MARGENLDKAIEYGLMASSVKVRHEGAQNGVPILEETNRALEKVEKNKEDDEKKALSDPIESSEYRFLELAQEILIKGLADTERINW